METLAKFIFTDSMQTLKVNESQKSVLLDVVDADSILKYLEKEELTFKFCRICEINILSDEQAHFQSKGHLKKREEMQLKEHEDYSLSMFVFQSVPGDIDTEL